jgi:hypothetical protein
MLGFSLAGSQPFAGHLEKSAGIGLPLPILGRDRMFRRFKSEITADCSEIPGIGRVRGGGANACERWRMTPATQLGSRP